MYITHTSSSPRSPTSSSSPSSPRSPASSGTSASSDSDEASTPRSAGPSAAYYYESSDPPATDHLSTAAAVEPQPLLCHIVDPALINAHDVYQPAYPIRRATFTSPAHTHVPKPRFTNSDQLSRPTCDRADAADAALRTTAPSRASPRLALLGAACSDPNIILGVSASGSPTSPAE